ncbi:MAG: DUF721 domain-containing protein [Bacteriovoracaceae bacterium]
MSSPKGSPKSLGDLLAQPDKGEEIYLSDQKKRYKRRQKGYFSKEGNAFDFIYLIRSWDKIVGKMMAQNTIPHKIMKSTLIVMTKHSVFAHELSFMGPQIIEKIEENIPDLRGRIAKIKFSHANYSWDEFQKANFQKTNRPAGARKLHPFSPQYQLKLKRANELFEDIEDQEVKELLTALFMEKI